MSKQASWHDQDAFWELVEPFLFTERRVELAREQVTQIIERLGTEYGARILDLPCGNGRHSCELAGRGFEVTGVDRTGRYIAAARQEARRRSLEAGFLTGDMRDYCQPEQYDAILNLFGSFGYFEDPADDLRVLKNMRDSLRPGGQVLVETAGKEIVARGFRPRDWFEEGELLVLTERQVTSDWGRIETGYVVFRGGERYEHTVSIRSFSAAELTALLETAGFSHVSTYGSLGGTIYDHDAERLVVIGRK